MIGFMLGACLSVPALMTRLNRGRWAFRAVYRRVSNSLEPGTWESGCSGALIRSAWTRSLTQGVSILALASPTLLIPRQYFA